jgi:peptidoglycan/xylan/chitin deacetylase (PgdA/CDA1 family)
MSTAPSGLQTLLYHRVCADNEWYPSPYVVTASAFRRQMEFLHARGYYTPALADVLDENVPTRNGHHRPFLLTFDDGYLDNFHYAFPVLKEFGFRAIIFLVADFSRRDNWWDLPDGVPRAPLLEPAHIREMGANGIEFGSHTLHHPHLPTLSVAALNEEVVHSRTTIEEIIQKPVESFSYPYSDLDGSVRAAVMAAGYRCAFAVNTGPRVFSSDLFEIRRLNVENGAGRLSMHAKMSGTEKVLLYSWWRGKRSLASMRARHHDSSKHEEQ